MITRLVGWLVEFYGISTLVGDPVHIYRSHFVPINLPVYICLWRSSLSIKLCQFIYIYLSIYIYISLFIAIKRGFLQQHKIVNSSFVYNSVYRSSHPVQPKFNWPTKKKKKNTHDLPNKTTFYKCQFLVNNEPIINETSFLHETWNKV